MTLRDVCYIGSLRFCQTQRKYYLTIKSGYWSGPSTGLIQHGGICVIISTLYEACMAINVLSIFAKQYKPKRKIESIHLFVICDITFSNISELLYNRMFVYPQNIPIV